MELPALVITEIESKRVRFNLPHSEPACKTPPFFSAIDGSEFQTKVLGEFRKQFTEQHPEFPQRVTNGIIHFGDDVALNELLTCPGNLDRHPGNQAWRVFLYKRIAQDGAPIPVARIGGRHGTIRYDGPPAHCPGRENTYTEMIFLEHIRLLAKHREHTRGSGTWSVQAIYHDG
jgi:hypothetical protein